MWSLGKHRNPCDKGSRRFAAQGHAFQKSSVQRAICFEPARVFRCVGPCFPILQNVSLHKAILVDPATTFRCAGSCFSILPRRFAAQGHVFQSYKNVSLCRAIFFDPAKVFRCTRRCFAILPSFTCTGLRPPSPPLRPPARPFAPLRAPSRFFRLDWLGEAKHNLYARCFVHGRIIDQLGGICACTLFAGTWALARYRKANLSMRMVCQRKSNLLCLLVLFFCFWFVFCLICLLLFLLWFCFFVLRAMGCVFAHFPFAAFTSLVFVWLVCPFGLPAFGFGFPLPVGFVWCVLRCAMRSKVMQRPWCSVLFVLNAFGAHMNIPFVNFVFPVFVYLFPWFLLSISISIVDHFLACVLFLVCCCFFLFCFLFLFSIFGFEKNFAPIEILAKVKFRANWNFARSGILFANWNFARSEISRQFKFCPKWNVAPIEILLLGLFFLGSWRDWRKSKKKI